MVKSRPRIKAPTKKSTVIPNTNVSKTLTIYDPISCFEKTYFSYRPFKHFYLVFYNNFPCLKTLVISKAFFLPRFVKEKEVFGFPVISFLFLKVLRGRSNLRLSGHLG